MRSSLQGLDHRLCQLVEAHLYLVKGGEDPLLNSITHELVEELEAVDLLANLLEGGEVEHRLFDMGEVNVTDTEEVLEALGLDTL